MENQNATQSNLGDDVNAARLTVCSLQPFYGGSHRQFIDGWKGASRLSWISQTLPDRHWKWRMRHAAIEFAERVDQSWQAGSKFDVILTTDMLNVAEFKGLLRTKARDCPIVVYFHENQFEYPNQQDRERDFHFGFTNLTSCLAADAVWFNSQYNLDSFVCHLRKLMKVWPDFQPVGAVEELLRKSSVHPPGIKLDDEQLIADGVAATGPIHLVWAARWEHDKNPDDLLRILERLMEAEVDFVASIIGQQYAKTPAAFAQIKELLGDRICHWGYLKTSDAYQEVLTQADVFLSTAIHEFFGIAAAEAIAAGCFPILPNRLAYPELVGVGENPDRARFLYASIEDAVGKIADLASDALGLQASNGLTTSLRKTSCWNRRANMMDNEIEAICNRMR